MSNRHLRLGETCYRTLFRLPHGKIYMTALTPHYKSLEDKEASSMIPCNCTSPALFPYAQAIMRTTSIAEGRSLGLTDKHLLISCATANGHSSGTLQCSTLIIWPTFGPHSSAALVICPPIVDQNTSPCQSQSS